MPPPQLTRLAWRYWLPTAMTFFVHGAAFGGWAAQVPRATTRLHVDEGTFGLMLLAMGIGSMIAMVFSGRLIARYDAGFLIRIGFVVFLASYVVLSTSAVWAVFVSGLLLFGAAGGVMDIAMNAYAADVETHMNWRVMASFHGLWSLGGLVGAGAASALLAVLPDLAHALALTAALALLFLVPQHNLAPLLHRAHAGSARRWTLDRIALVLGLLAALCFSAEGSVRDWSSLFLTDEIAAGIERAGWGYAAFSATMALGRLTGDWMRTRFGERNVVLLSGLVAVVGFVMAVAFADYLLAVIGFALVGLGLSNIVPILISAAGRAATPGATIAFVVSLGYAGYLASPPVLGFIASHSSLAAMFAIVAAACAAISIGWLLVERAQARR